MLRSVRPEGEISAEWISENHARFFLLEHVSKGFQLRGEFVILEGGDRFLFLGSPWFTDTEQVALLDLGYEDFAIHDPVLDMLQVFQASKMALADAKKLSAKLTAQRAELRVINERLRSQAADYQKLALIAARTDNAVVLTDARGLILWVNEGFTILTGYTVQEVLGKKPGSVLQGPDSDPGVIQRMQEKLREGQGFSEEIVNYGKDGRKYWVSIEVQPIQDDEGKLTNFMAIERNITERKRVTAELLKAKEVAESANRAKSDFLAMMSHEIRTPMNGVLGMTNLLLRTRLDAQQEEFVRTVAKSGEALIEIINDILDFSKIEAGEHFQLEEVVFSPLELVKGVVQLLSPRAQVKGVALETHLGPDLPRCLRGDDGRLRQVLVNLVGNAIKFTDVGIVTLRVTALNQGASSRLRFEVRDTGIGIAAADLSLIFAPFTQAQHGMARRRGGTGLGLPISKRIVELMGGGIGVESVIGSGSLFWFEVQLEAVQAQEEEFARGTPTTSVTTDGVMANSCPLRILVVEDNDVNRRLAMFMLETLGYAADFAGNGLEAIEACLRGDYDVIFMDCQMPEMDGFEATREIRQGELRRGVEGVRRARIVALTANALKGDRDRCLAVGMDGYISKPFTLDQLRHSLELAWASRGDSTARLEMTDPSAASVPDVSSVRVFNPTCPSTLLEELDTDSVRLILNDCVRELPGRVAQLVGLAGSGKLEEAMAMAHSIKGTAPSVGLDRLALQCGRLEQACKVRDFAEIKSLIEQLPASAGEGVDELRRWVDERPFGP